jgi:predicted flap endonuclease-1-like 5' DNA nuclease
VIQKYEFIDHSDKNKSIEILSGIHGIGPVIASKLYASGIKNIEDMRKHQEKLTEI